MKPTRKDIMIKLRLTRDVLVVRAEDLQKGDRFKFNKTALKVMDSTVQTLNDGTSLIVAKNLGRLGRARQLVMLAHDTKLKIVR